MNELKPTISAYGKKAITYIREVIEILRKQFHHLSLTNDETSV
jgi:hypothetical protein